MNGVLLLNTDYSYLNIIDWKKAICMVMTKKAEVIQNSDRIVHSINSSVYVPAVIKLVKLVRQIYKTKVPYSRKNILIRDEFVCQYCGSKNGPMTIDHVLPQSKGGKSSFENCVACCKKCNNEKTDRTPGEAGMSLRKRPYRPTIMEFIQARIRINKMEDFIDDLMSELTNGSI